MAAERRAFSAWAKADPRLVRVPEDGALYCARILACTAITEDLTHPAYTASSPKRATASVRSAGKLGTDVGRTGPPLNAEVSISSVNAIVLYSFAFSWLGVSGYV